MKSIVCEKSSNDSQCTTSTQSSGFSDKQSVPSTKSETRNSQNQGAIKKRLRYRVETIRKKSLQDSDDEEEKTIEQKKYPKLLRSRTISEESTKSLEPTEIGVSKNTNIFPAVIKSTYPESPTKVKSSDSPITIFVKTTRKLFTPFVERSLQDSEETPQKLDHEGQKKDENVGNSGTNEFEIEKDRNEPSRNTESPVIGLPPLPSPPVSQKKYLKDMSPSIRLMLNKYQQKLTEQEHVSKSGGSSGSASPVAWRSPTAERRVRAQTEKYQEEIIKLSPLATKREIHKSISQGNIQNMNKTISENLEMKNSDNKVLRQKSILKSCSAANLIQKKYEFSLPPYSTSPYSSQTITSDGPSTSTSSELRLQKLRKAKEEFLNSEPNSAPPLENKSDMAPDFTKKNRLSTISVESSSSAGSISPGVLVKSISAGMINIVADAYKHFEGKPREYVSLPRNTRPECSKKSALSNLASKFRKVKMRKGKEKEKSQYSAVSELCRQSLVVDINETNQDNVSPNNSSYNMNILQDNLPTPISKSSSWIRKSMFFKK